LRLSAHDRVEIGQVELAGSKAPTKRAGYYDRVARSVWRQLRREWRIAGAISRTRVDCFAIENVQNRNYAHLLNAGRLQVGANPRTIKRRLSRRTEHA
jgi:hypothetical protein